MHIRLAQLAISRDSAQNSILIRDLVAESKPGTWLVFPEGMLSGCDLGEPDFWRRLDADVVNAQLNALHNAVGSSGCVVVLGSLVPGDGGWHSSAVLLQPGHTPQTYHKLNLQGQECEHLVAGDRLAVMQADGMTVGVQLGHELLFPEQWTALRRDGAQVMFHLNRDLSRHTSNWRHVLQARAIENQCWVVSVNRGHSQQRFPSLVVAPDGEITAEMDLGTRKIRYAILDMTQVRDDYVGQARRDVVDVVVK